MFNEIKRIEGKFQDFVEKHFFTMGVVVLLFFSVLLRYFLAPFTEFSMDYFGSLVPWVTNYQQLGIIDGLSQRIGDYYVPYNIILSIVAHTPWEPWVLISLVSCFFEYVGAYFIYKIALLLLREKNPADEPWVRQRAILASLITLFLPATIINGALWKQCDSIYTCFVIISLYYLLREKCGRSLLWLGVAFSFKQQAIFILPLFVALYVFRKKELSLLHFLYIPLCYALAGLPAILLGRGAADTFGTYFRQSEMYSYITMNFPNLYSFNLTVYYVFYYPAILGTMAVFVFMALALNLRKKELGNATILYLGIWCFWTSVMFLPAMHDRYNYPVLVLLTAFYIVHDIKKFWIAVAINLMTTIIYGNFLFGTYSTIAMIWLAIFHMAVYVYVTYDLYHNLRETKRPLARG